MRRLGPDPRRIDWFRVLTDLKYAGVPINSVAMMIRVPHGTVKGWKDGAEPKYADGEKLIEFWVQITGRLPDTVPRAQPVIR
jgi:hypothetical protein